MKNAYVTTEVERSFQSCDQPLPNISGLTGLCIRAAAFLGCCWPFHLHLVTEFRLLCKQGKLDKAAAPQLHIFMNSSYVPIYSQLRISA